MQKVLSSLWATKTLCTSSPRPTALYPPYLYLCSCAITVIDIVHMCLFLPTGAYLILVKMLLERGAKYGETLRGNLNWNSCQCNCMKCSSSREERRGEEGGKKRRRERFPGQECLPVTWIFHSLHACQKPHSTHTHTLCTKTFLHKRHKYTHAHIRTHTNRSPWSWLALGAEWYI